MMVAEKILTGILSAKVGVLILFVKLNRYFAVCSIAGGLFE